MLKTQLTLSAVADRDGPGGRSSTERLSRAIAGHLSPRAGGSIVDWDSDDALQTRTAFIVQAIDQAFACPMCVSELTGITESDLRGQWGDR